VLAVVLVPKSSLAATFPKENHLAANAAPLLRREASLFETTDQGGELGIAEKQIELSSGGVRGLIGGVGFLIIAGLGFGWSTRSAVIGFFALAFAFVFLAAGVSRLVQANALKRLREARKSEHTPALAAGDADYIQPKRSLFQTGDLDVTPSSITEHTTTRLEIDRKGADR
jgi:hypothetical protein